VSLPSPTLAHLRRMTDDTGVFEHAVGSVPNRHHGYCTDDNGRALALMSRMSGDAEAGRIADVSLAFLQHAFEDGRFRLRLAYDRRWTEHPPSDDADGRALFGLGVAAARGPDHLRWTARELFEEAGGRRSEHARATAYAALGAVEVLAAHGASAVARSLVTEALATLPRPVEADWSWPAPRLTYANAILPEALIAAGAAAGDDGAVEDGLRMLGWLVRIEALGDRFSFAPTGGWAPGEPRPGFDQQPIEAAATADACARAFDVTGDAAWLDPLARAAWWFLGLNDAEVPLLDPVTGGVADGLEPAGVSRNQGAESVLAGVAALQQAQRLLPAALLEAPPQTRAAASASSS